MRRAGAALALSAGTLLACASPEERHDAPAEPEADAIVTVSGRVTVTGSEPRTTLVVVTDEDVEYELAGEPAADLRAVQQRRVTVRGRVVRKAFGPGFPARLLVDSWTLAGGGRAP